MYPGAGHLPLLTKHELMLYLDSQPMQRPCSGGVGQFRCGLPACSDGLVLAHIWVLATRTYLMALLCWPAAAAAAATYVISATWVRDRASDDGSVIAGKLRLWRWGLNG